MALISRPWILLVTAGTIVAALTSCSDVPDDTASEALTSYLDADTPQERAKLVLDPDSVVSIMGYYYDGEDLSGVQDIEVDSSGPLEIGERGVLSARWTQFGSSGQLERMEREYDVMRTEDGYRVDWLRSTGYEWMPIPAFKSLRVGAPGVTYRMLATLDDFYNYEYMRAQATHLSIRLQDPASTEYFTGYVARGSEDGRHLFDLLDDGREYWVTVRIAYPGSYREGNAVTILGYVESSLE